MSSEKRNLTVDNWIKWYDMKVVDETDTYTDLILADDDILLELKMEKTGLSHSSN